VPLATIVLDFDPLLHAGGAGIRWETLGLAGVILAALLLAAIIAGGTDANEPHLPMWARSEDVHLRRDDLLFIVLGIVPGAVVGGRLGYVLLHLDFYSATTSAIWDPGQGSLELGLGVVCGVLTGTYVARLLDAPVGRWIHVATVPVFVAIGLGELARLAGGSGQGASADVAWSVAFAGPGPWGSLAAQIPAHPAQLYGAVAAFAALLFVGVLRLLGAFAAQDGSAFFVGLFAWSLGRCVVTMTWRDDPVLGPIPAGGLLALGVAVVAVVGYLLARRAGQRAREQAHALNVGAAGPDPRGRLRP
jgi:phosphatidylglycerol:prolipoprotein diacylglycerol transferase